MKGLLPRGLELAIIAALASADEHDCSAWNNDCRGCIQNEDTTGWVTTDCQYCFASGECSGAVPKPYCGSSDWVDHGDVCEEPVAPHDCSAWNNDCNGCIQNQDTTGSFITDCQYCFASGECSGAVPKPNCDSTEWVDHGDVCVAPAVKQDCSAWNNDCYGCMQNQDTTGSMFTDCQYCFITNECSGAVPKPACGNAEWVDRDDYDRSCANPPHDCSAWDNDCGGCLANSDTAGSITTACQYCFSSGSCSGASPKPSCPEPGEWFGQDTSDVSCSDPPHRCDAWNGDCRGCLQNQDTMGTMTSDCQYCFVTNECSGAVPKPECGNNEWVDRDDSDRSCANPPHDCSAFSVTSSDAAHQNAACERCISHTDTTGSVETDCMFCTVTGECSGAYPKPSCDANAVDNNGWIGHWVDTGQSCSGPPERNSVDVVVDTASCVAKGVGGILNSVWGLVRFLGGLGHGRVGNVCTKVVSMLAGQGVGAVDACDTSQLCELLGPEAMICDAVFVGVCVVNSGEEFNACRWLLDAADINPTTICTGIEQELGIVEDNAPAQCADTLTSLCANAKRASVGNCLQCYNTHKSEAEGVGCSDDEANSFCSSGSGH